MLLAAVGPGGDQVGGGRLQSGRVEHGAAQPLHQRRVPRPLRLLHTGEHQHRSGPFGRAGHRRRHVRRHILHVLVAHLLRHQVVSRLPLPGVIPGDGGALRVQLHTVCNREQHIG